MGTVLDALGEPVPTADVWATRSPDEQPPLARARTDGAGTFVLTGVPCDDKQSLLVYATAAGRTRERTWTTLRTPAQPAIASLRLWDAGTIRGRVVDAAGKPIAGASVLGAYDESRLFGFEPAAVATSDDQGAFVLEKVPLGWIQVRAWAPGHVVQTTDLWLAETCGTEIKLAAGDGVTLDVTVEGLPPDVRARVSVLPYARGGHEVLPGILVNGPTEADGRWVRRGLPDLEFVVSANAKGFSFEPDSTRTKAGRTKHELRFRAVRDGSITMTGVLRDADGRPLARQRLVCRRSNGGRDSTATTGDDGKFTLASPLAAGTKAIVYLASSDLVLAQPKNEEHIGFGDARFLGWHELVVEDGLELDLRAQKAATVSGRLMTPESRPVRFRRLELQELTPNRTPAGMTFAWATTDREGRFVFRGLHAPKHDLRVSTGDLAASASALFQLGAGASVDGLDLVLQPASVVEGTVRDDNGRPIAGARVWLRNHDVATGRQTSGAVFEVLTDRNGRYRHIDVEPGGHRVQLLLDTHDRIAQASSDPFECEPGKTVKQDLVATPRDR